MRRVKIDGDFTPLSVGEVYEFNNCTVIPENLSVECQSYYDYVHVSMDFTVMASEWDQVMKKLPASSVHVPGDRNIPAQP